MRFIVDSLPIVQNKCPFCKTQYSSDAAAIQYICVLDERQCNLMFDNVHRGCRWLKVQ
jgi:hypothetical protein